jgi:hypothetical protein
MLQIHSKKRNRLEHKRLHNLVYVKYNQALLRRYNYMDEIDPISLGNIENSCNEWLVGMMDGDEVLDAGNERVFEDENDEDALNWEAVYRASEAREPTRYTRQTTKKRKVTPGPSVVGTTSKTKKKSAGASSSRKGKQRVIEVEDDPVESEVEFEDIDSDESIEEAEGYASLSENEDNDYVGENEDN